MAAPVAASAHTNGRGGRHYSYGAPLKLKAISSTMQRAVIAASVLYKRENKVTEGLANGLYRFVHSSKYQFTKAGIPTFMGVVGENPRSRFISSISAKVC